MYEYRCKILKVIDGDTVDVDIDLGFGVWMHKERVRLLGIDTPFSSVVIGTNSFWLAIISPENHSFLIVFLPDLYEAEPFSTAIETLGLKVSTIRFLQTLFFRFL